jgi:hypothetical protein
MEAAASYRWRRRIFTGYSLEKRAVEGLLKWASRRYEEQVKGGKVKGVVDIMDWGVRLAREGARGEWLTGEIQKGGAE